MSVDNCSENSIHPDRICRAKEIMPNETALRDMTELFKVLADETRLRMISALQHCELCVCDLAALIDASQSAVSHQLRILRQARLVRYRREGRNAFYSLDDEHIDSLAQVAKDHVLETYQRQE